VGKEASLFVPSGTMGNLCALLSHTQPGQEVIVEVDSHIFQNEVAGASVVGGLQLRPLDTPDGRVQPEQVRRAIRQPDIHEPVTGLLCLENTHNRKGGTCLSPKQTAAVSAVAHDAGFPVHLDGARVFNAAVALGVDVRELTGPVDSVMFCLSKGLSAPVGSMLAGSTDFIERSRRVRKMLGGGMRQAGVLAAAGLIALRESPQRLHIDHENARFLAEGIAAIPQLAIDATKVQTNIVICDCSKTGKTAVEFCAELYPYGIWAQDTALHSVRFVTHCDVESNAIERALPILRHVAANTKKAKA